MPTHPPARVRRVVAAAALLLAAPPAARAGAPPVIDWHAAERLVGEVVTVEGDVVVARNLGDTCTLEFSADDPRAFRIVLVLPLITDLPRQPDRLYQGRRVRARRRTRAECLRLLERAWRRCRPHGA